MASKLDSNKLYAAGLIAAGELSRADIASEVGVSERQVYRWLLDPEFQAEVENALSRIRKDVLPEVMACLRRAIRGQDKVAVMACQLLLKQAGWLDKQPEAKPELEEGMPKTIAYLPSKDPQWAELDREDPDED